MIRRSTGILIAVLILAVAATWYFEWSPIASARLTPTPTSTPKLFEGLQLSTIRKIELTSDKNETVTLNFGNGNSWQLAENSANSVDQGKVTEILDSLLTITPLSSITSNPSSDATGLTTPAYRLSITTSDNKIWTLNVGKLTATTSGYYSQLDGTSGIVLLDKFTVDDLISKFTVSNLTAPTPTAISLTVVPTILPTETSTTVPSPSAEAASPTSQSTPPVATTTPPEQTPTK
jgi:hypothetical protein